MTQLLDDKALQEAIAAQLGYEPDDYGTYNKVEKTAPVQEVERLFALVKEQRQAWADKVIGEDESIPQLHNAQYILEAHDVKLKNQLKAEQRKRNTITKGK